MVPLLLSVAYVLCVATAGEALVGRAGGLRTLVVLPKSVPDIKFSIYLKNLRRYGFELDVTHGFTSAVEDRLNTAHSYDNIAVFHSGLQSKHFAAISGHVERGGGLLLALDNDLPPPARAFLRTVGIAVEPNASRLVDHSSYLPIFSGADTAPHTAVLVEWKRSPRQPTPILRQFGRGGAPLLYRGIGLRTEDSSLLATTVLEGNLLSTMSASVIREAARGGSAGLNAPALCTAIQARSNARVVVTGSVDMFTNDFIKAKTKEGEKVGNEDFCQDISLWAFSQTGVLRHRGSAHRKSDGSEPETVLRDRNSTWELAQSMYPEPEASRSTPVYRVGDEVVYSLIVEEFSGYGEGKEETWHPFVADDIQLEFVMLDPYVRQTMSLCNTDGRLCDAAGQYSTTISVPDVHGVFKFRVLYRRRGFSVLHAEDEVLVRPFKHNEFERFIPAAMPYYISIFSLMTGFVLLSFTLLFT